MKRRRRPARDRLRRLGSDLLDGLALAGVVGVLLAIWMMWS